MRDFFFLGGSSVKHDSMLFFFNFVKFCKNIQHCEFMIIKNVKFECLINYGITIAKAANLLGLERRSGL